MWSLDTLLPRSQNSLLNSEKKSQNPDATKQAPYRQLYNFHSGKDNFFNKSGLGIGRLFFPLPIVLPSSDTILASGLKYLIASINAEPVV